MPGVIAAGHPETAAAGAEILRQGGNAVDAAVAATFASFVAESALVNIGGGGIAQVYDPAAGQAIVYDFFSAMPGLSANGRMSTLNLDFRRILVDFGAAQQPFYIGRGSVAVPGVVAGLCAMLEDRGTLPLSAVLTPAIRLAREGVRLSEIQGYITGLLTPILTDTPGVAAIYAPAGQMARAGQTLYFTALAETLEQLGRQGPLLFYTGAVAQKIVADQQVHGGLLTQADLAGYRVLRAEPIRLDYRGYTVLLSPPSSIGGVLIGFALKLLASQPLPAMRHNSAVHLRVLAEVMRLTTIARTEWDRQGKESGASLFDLVEHLLADSHITRYRAWLDEALAGQNLLPDPGQPQGPANTSHLSVADTNGLIAGVTTSAGESAGFVVADTGVMLNNMLGEIDLHPNGFHQLPPGQRLMTMMSPVLVLRRGQPLMAIGSGGSNRIRSAILQVLSNVIDFDLSLEQAVEAPRLHFEDNLVQLEGGLDPALAAELEALGYTVNRWPGRNMFFGGAHAVARSEDGSWLAAGDSRRGGSVARVGDR
jgi:gamma-glutamyltranspeptidase/glutathione hydrolase